METKTEPRVTTLINTVHESCQEAFHDSPDARLNELIESGLVNPDA